QLRPLDQTRHRVGICERRPAEVLNSTRTDREIVPGQAVRGEQCRAEGIVAQILEGAEVARSRETGGADCDGVGRGTGGSGPRERDIPDRTSTEGDLIRVCCRSIEQHTGCEESRTQDFNLHYFSPALQWRCGRTSK